MTSTTRTDPHRPSAIVPADYEYVGCFYQGSSDEMYRAYSRDHTALGDALEAVLGTDEFGPDTVGRSGYEGNYAAKGTCDLCGTSFAHGAVYRHRPTGHVVTLGHTCADEVGLGLDEAQQARRRAERAAEAAATHARYARLRDEFLTANPEIAAIFDEWAEIDTFVGDVYRRWHGNPEKALSEKQIAALLKVPARRAEWAARDAARNEAEAERLANAEPVPDDGKRHEITGTILSTREDDTEFGTVTKMLVLTTAGFKLWGTMPRSLGAEWGYVDAEDDPEGTGGYMQVRAAAEVGDEIRFTARLERSDRDEHFGFYSRPTKAEVVARAAVEAAAG